MLSFYHLSQAQHPCKEHKRELIENDAHIKPFQHVSVLQARCRNAKPALPLTVNLGGLHKIPQLQKMTIKPVNCLIRFVAVGQSSEV